MIRNLKRSTGLFIFLAFLFGFITVCIIIGEINNTKERFDFFKTALETEGQISEIKTDRDREGKIHYYASVNYEIDGQSYKDIPLPYYTSDMFAGDSITLFYDPENPYHIEIKTASLFLTIIVFVAALICGAIAIGFTIPVIRWQGQKKLRKTGLYIRLPIASLNVDTSTTENGTPGNYVICEGTNPITGRRQRYVSEHYYSSLDAFMKPGDIVPVYLDRNNPDKYFVDVAYVEPQDITAETPPSTSHTQ